MVFSKLRQDQKAPINALKIDIAAPQAISSVEKTTKESQMPGWFCRV